MTYTFTINALDVLKEKDGLQGVVYTIHWALTAENENGTTASAIGTKTMSDPNPDSFTPYDQLTEEIVVGWLKAEEVDSDFVKEGLDKQIAEKETPVKETVYNPFAKEETTTL